MADFYPLLRRAIEGLPDNTPEARRTIYERARSVLLTQLRSLDPPMSEGDIARERLALEDVIRRIEGELAEEHHPPSPADDDIAELEAASAGRPLRGSADRGGPSGEAPSPPASRRPRLDAGSRTAGASRRRRLVVGVVLAVVIAGIAGLAYWANVVNRSETPPPAVTADQTGESQRGKINERLGGEPAPVPAPAPVAPAPAPAQPTQSAQPAIPVSQRAILYEEVPGSPQAPTAHKGRAVWRIDGVNPGQGLPLETVVKADVEIPEAGLTLAMVIRRNTDSTLPASHTIELNFGKTQGGEGRSIRDVGVPQLKAEEGTRGTPLAGLPVPVTENLFLIGLSNTPADVERNLDFLRNRQWIDVPIRYTNGRRAVLAFEKGVSGDRAITEALKAWQQR